MPKDRSPRRRPARTTPLRPVSSPPHRRWPYFLAALSLVLAAVAAYGVFRLPWLSAQEVRVVGTQTLDQDALVELSGLQGESMLSLPLGEARKRFLQIPQIKAVSFDRQWPNKVTIRVAERIPWGFWSVGGKDYPVDNEGVVLAAGAPSGAAPYIIEPGSDRVMGAGDRVDSDAIALVDRIFRESPQVLSRSVRELEYQPGVGVTAVFDNGLRVTFGDARAYEYKMSVLSTLLGRLSSQGVSPQAVDLRFGARVTYE